MAVLPLHHKERQDALQGTMTMPELERQTMLHMVCAIRVQ